jgi:hypothetical protein
VGGIVITVGENAPETVKAPKAAAKKAPRTSGKAKASA